jgi:hypothetical protein
LSTSVNPNTQHNALHNDIEIGRSLIRRKKSPTIIRKDAAPNGNHRCEKLPHELFPSARGHPQAKVRDIDQIVNATAQALLRPALQETLLRVQELEHALDEQKQCNEHMKHAMANDLIKIQELQQDLSEQRQRNFALQDALVFEMARTENLEMEIRQERHQKEQEVQKILARVHLVKETMIRQACTEISTEQMCEIANIEEERYEECTVGDHIAMDWKSRQCADGQMSLEKMVRRLVSDNDNLNTFTEKVVGKNCFDGFVENAVLNALCSIPECCNCEESFPEKETYVTYRELAPGM